MLYLVGTFNFNAQRFSPGEAERHYLEHHVPLARRLPGLRQYAIGQLLETRTVHAQRYRGAILGFDNLDTLRAAYASPIGQELRRDEDLLIADPHAILIGGEEVMRS